MLWQLERWTANASQPGLLIWRWDFTHTHVPIYRVAQPPVGVHKRQEWPGLFQVQPHRLCWFGLRLGHSASVLFLICLCSFHSMLQVTVSLATPFSTPPADCSRPHSSTVLLLFPPLIYSRDNVQCLMSTKKHPWWPLSTYSWISPHSRDLLSLLKWITGTTWYRMLPSAEPLLQLLNF